EEVPPALVGELVRTLRPRDTGVVDEDVEPAETLLDLPNRGLDRGGVADVAFEGGGAVRRKRSRDGLPCVQCDISDDGVPALRREAAAGRLTDSASASRDESDRPVPRHAYSPVSMR